MTRTTSQPRLGALFAALAAFLLFVLPPGAARAADPAAVATTVADAPVASKAQLDQLIKTLEDPDKRDKLVGQLKLLVAAEKANQDAEEPGLLSLITDEVQDLTDEVLGAATSLTDVGHMADWVTLQVSDPRLRNAWAEVLGKLAAILGGGLLAERLLLLLLRPLRRLLENRKLSNGWGRLMAIAGLWLLDLLPIAAFILVAHGLRAIPELSLAGDPRQASIYINTAYLLSRLVLAVVAAILLPGNPGIRLTPIDDETANYLTIWARRLTISAVWGYFLVQALKLMGMPKSGYNFSLKALGLVVATLLVILVLQNRQTVAAWIRSRGEGKGNAGEGIGGRMQGVRNRLADIWHILAGLYIVASFAIWALQVKGGFEFIVRASLLTVVVLISANVAAGALARLVDRAFAISEELRGRFPHLEARANRYLAIMHTVVRVVVALATLLALAQAWGANTLSWLGSELGRRLISSTLAIAAVLVGALIVWELVNSSIDRYLSQTDAAGNMVERGSRARTLLPLLRNVVMVILVVLVTLIVLSELGVNIAPLLAGAGVVGVAIGFGSQKLVQDVITGAFILFEDTIAVGDAVKIGDYAGTVEGLTIRTMRLRDANGQVHTVPFSNVNTVTNMSRDFGFHIFDIGVSYREDVDQVMGVIKQLGEELRNDREHGLFITDPVEVFGVEKFTDSAVVIRGRIKTFPGKQWAIGREFNRLVKNRFDELGIEIPYPTTTLYFGADKDGKAPAAHVRIEHSPVRSPAAEARGPAPYSGDAVDYPMGEEVKA